PLAAPLLAKAKEIPLLPVENFQSVSGKGVTGNINGQTAAIGNKQLLVDLQIDLPAYKAEGKTVLYLALENKVVGIFEISDAIKSSTYEAIDQLHQDGLTLVMATGDNKTAAHTIGQQLKIDAIEAEVLPQDKHHLVQRLQHEGHRVAMAGDGINDAPALAAADVGIAMGTGTDIAIESADITLVKGDLRGIARARRLSLATMRNIRQNLWFAFIYNALGVPIAAGLLYPFFGLLLSPVIASAAMTLSSVSVIANALRLRRVKI
ncbi:MAG TPA: HAD-IC family P-type ATPase, partial [Candidatus Babeliaceae bacterium]|nr:HAD-IC family P-type ATPase [Candidatus Babeliaceae bacterium]